MTDTNTAVTPATRDAAARAAEKTAGDAAMARLTEEFNNSPNQRIARDEAELSRLQSDPFHLNQKAAGNRVAEAQESAIQSRLAVAKAEAAKLHGSNRIERALTTDATSDPLFDSTVDGELSMTALRSQIADYRELGLNDIQINQAVNGAKYHRVTIDAARQLYEQRMSDPEWTRKLAAGDKLVKREHALIGICLNATCVADDVQADT
jgi:hypothetical protein